MDYFLLKLLLFIASLPNIYSLFKIYYHKELNLFDLLIIFHTLFFCYIPILSSTEALEFVSNTDVINTFFIFYSSFIFPILIINYLWTKYYYNKKCIINITRYISHFPQIKISNLGLLIIGINLLVSFIWYLPQASVLEMFGETNNVFNKVSTTYHLYSIFFSFILCLSLFMIIKGNITGIKHKTLLIITIGYLILLFFLPRRTFVTYLIYCLILIYSFNRYFFNFKRIIMIFVGLLFIFKVYFPFYNIMRFNSIRFDINQPISSLHQVINYSFDNYQNNIEFAEETTERRSLNLFYALYQIIKVNDSPLQGQLLIKAIDHAIPKIINPNKGEGSTILLENKTRLYQDQAESILLHAFADFNYLGGIYAILLYFLIFFLYRIIYIFGTTIIRNKTFTGVIITYSIISTSWNVEGNLDGRIANAIHILILITIIAFLYQVRAIILNK